MDFVTGQNAYEKMRQDIKPEPQAQPGNFWDPIGEMDPHQRPATPGVFVKTHVFKFRVFNLAGAYATPEDGLAYVTTKDLIFTPKEKREEMWVQISEDTYHSKDGDISVLLRWLEPRPAAVIKIETEAQVKEVEAQLEAQMTAMTTEVEPPKKRRGRKKKEEIDDMGELPSDFFSPDGSLEE